MAEAISPSISLTATPQYRVIKMGLAASIPERESPRRLLVVAVWLAAALLAAFLVGPRAFSAGDTHRYVAMVAGETVPAPFAYRVLVPGIVRALPVGIETGFLITTALFSFLTLFVFHRLLRRIGAGEPAALITTAALAFAYPIAFYLGRWGLIEPAANLALVLALYCFFNDRPGWMALTVFVGVTAKESVLLLLPLLLWAVWRRGRPPVARLGYSALAVVPPLLLLAFLRARIPVEPSVYDVAGPDDLRALWAFILDYNLTGYGFIPRLGREFLRSYGFFWAFAALGWRFVPSRATQMVCLYLVAVSAGLCVVATDWSRMLAFGFPGVFIPAAFLVERGLTRANGRAAAAALLLLSAAQGYIALLSYEEMSSMGQMSLIGGSVLLFAAGSLLAVYLARATPDADAAVR